MTAAPNPHNLPPHLVGMTQSRWISMTPAQRDAARDESKLHPKLKAYLGKKVRVEPKREYGLSTFRVGQTTGWRPVTLAVRVNGRGSSDIVRPDEVFTRIVEVQ